MAGLGTYYPWIRGHYCTLSTPTASNRPACSPEDKIWLLCLCLNKVTAFYHIYPTNASHIYTCVCLHDGLQQLQATRAEWSGHLTYSYTKGRFTHTMLFPCHSPAVPQPSRSANALDCVFPIWFTQCDHVWFTHTMPLPCPAMNMPFWKWPHKATAGSWHGNGMVCVN
jgi:hypothetical protein